ARLRASHGGGDSLRAFRQGARRRDDHRDRADPRRGSGHLQLSRRCSRVCGPLGRALAPARGVPTSLGSRHRRRFGRWYGHRFWMSASQPQSAMARRDGPPSDAWLRSLSRLNAEARALSLEPDGVTPVEQVLARCKEHLDACLDLSKDPRVPDVFVDLFELMRFELHDLRRGLHRLDDASDISTVLEPCDRVRGATVPGTELVALSGPEGLGAAADLQEWRQRIARDVTTALLVRRLYTVFRRQMRVNLEGSQERELVAALRRVSTQIEVVRRQP